MVAAADEDIKSAAEDLGFSEEDAKKFYQSCKSILNTYENAKIEKAYIVAGSWNIKADGETKKAEFSKIRVFNAKGKWYISETEHFNDEVIAGILQMISARISLDSGSESSVSRAQKAADCANADSVVQALKVYGCDPNVSEADMLQDGATVTLKKGSFEVAEICTGNADKALSSCGITNLGLKAGWSDNEVNGIVLKVTINAETGTIDVGYASNSDPFKEGHNLLNGEYK